MVHEPAGNLENQMRLCSFELTIWSNEKNPCFLYCGIVNEDIMFGFSYRRQKYVKFCENWNAIALKSGCPAVLY